MGLLSPYLIHKLHQDIHVCSCNQIIAYLLLIYRMIFKCKDKGKNKQQNPNDSN